MRVCGVDLAAEPKNTGLALLHDDGTQIALESVVVGVVDDHVIETVQDVEYTGVDVPFGWPQPFAAFVEEHAKQTLPPPATTGPTWRRELALRTTDREVHRATGLTPLSVSANLIAYPAFRWAGIEARLRDQQIDVSRDGSGAVAEVYPAAALYRWGLPHTGYKGTQRAAIRQQIMTGLTQRFPTLDWNGYAALVVANDNALDAIIAGLVSHQIRRGQCEGPPLRYRETAQIEGWIWLPQRSDR
ncbi:DUF429 domain-containing protein [Enteractinococcus coprophilus]|uniref:Uncharacterized protein DUF429 n=1 Tax=Enteractinococcus coprophilus TaxID=1027633 RepID=A0A543A076_9MICC|nr:DUF429 domain-containing protein [Enteractinococcus coprophilus]TQL65991.1 uncharacterized protein DUF429 [Enteractinococcus coprophilus]